MTTAIINGVVTELPPFDDVQNGTIVTFSVVGGVTYMVKLQGFSDGNFEVYDVNVNNGQTYTGGRIGQFEVVDGFGSFIAPMDVLACVFVPFDVTLVALGTGLTPPVVDLNADLAGFVAKKIPSKNF